MGKWALKKEEIYQKQTKKKILQSRSWYKHSEETKRKISINGKGRKMPPVSEKQKLHMSKIMKIVAKEKGYGKKEGFGNICKKVLQFSKKGKLMKEWESLTEASNTGKFSLTAISEVCNNKPNRKTHKGYVWKFKDM